MEQAGAGPGQRRLRAVSPHTAAEAPLARGDAAPEVQDLLAQLDDLRLSLSTDLGVVASAVDADALGVARDVLAGAQDDLAVFEVRAGHLLRDPVAPLPLPAAPRARRRSYRLSVLAPGLTAAAALVGVLLGVVPSTTPPAAPDSSIATDAASSWDELRRLHEQGASPDQLARAARQLHAEVGRLVAGGASPRQVTEALRLLELQRRVLSDPEHADAMDAELAQSQRLVAALRASVLGTPVGTLLADGPLPDPRTSALPVPVGQAPSRSGDAAQDEVPEVPATAPRPRPAVVPAPAPAPEPARPPQPGPPAADSPPPADSAPPPDSSPADDAPAADEPTPAPSPGPSASPSPAPEASASSGSLPLPPAGLPPQ